MRRGVLLSGCALAFAALTAGVGSCSRSGGGSSVTASGSTLTIYASAPPPDAAAADVLDAQRLAFQQFQQSGAKIGKFTIKFATAHSAKLSDNARTAIENTGAVAYIGELAPGASADSMGITNAQDVLQVSPTDTAIELTQPTAAVPGAPDSYYESRKTYGRTFARVVPSAAQEAKAQLQEMAALGVRSVFVTSDGSPYGAAIALAVKNGAGSSGVTVASSKEGAGAIFYGGVAASAHAFEALAAANPTIKLFGPSALSSATPPAGDRSVYVSAPGFLPKELPAAGRKFVADFRTAYGHPPALQAIFGYEAVSAVLAVLREAGSSASDRAAVVRDFFAIKNRSSALGTYSIDAGGDISIAPFVFSRSLGGKLVPFRFVQVQG